MANLVAELNDLALGQYILAPMQGAIDAQNSASLSTINFIQNVGFEPPGEDGSVKLRYVDFNFKKKVPNPDFDSSQSAGPNNPALIEQDVEIHIPLISMMILPAIRIEELTIEFNAKLTSVETTSTSSEFAAAAELDIKYRAVNFKASASYKSTTSSGSQVEKTYNLGITVKAINDAAPPALDRIMQLLENSIASA
jgi:hypothetical protein